MYLSLIGQEAKKLFDDAQTMLKKIIKNKSLKADGVVAFYPANSVGDDIEVYDSNAEVKAVLYGLRQQVFQNIMSHLNKKYFIYWCLIWCLYMLFINQESIDIFLLCKNIHCGYPLEASLSGSFRCTSDWRSESCVFDPHWFQQYSFMEIDSEILPTFILSLLMMLRYLED